MLASTVCWRVHMANTCVIHLVNSHVAHLANTCVVHLANTCGYLQLLESSGIP